MIGLFRHLFSEDRRKDSTGENKGRRKDDALLEQDRVCMEKNKDLTLRLDKVVKELRELAQNP